MAQKNWVGQISEPLIYQPELIRHFDGLDYRYSNECRYRIRVVPDRAKNLNVRMLRKAPEQYKGR